jgi:hypothetical protein
VFIGGWRKACGRNGQHGLSGRSGQQGIKALVGFSNFQSSLRDLICFRFRPGTEESAQYKRCTAKRALPGYFRFVPSGLRFCSEPGDKQSAQHTSCTEQRASSPRPSPPLCGREGVGKGSRLSSFVHMGGAVVWPWEKRQRAAALQNASRLMARYSQPGPFQESEMRPTCLSAPFHIGRSGSSALPSFGGFGVA